MSESVDPVVLTGAKTGAKICVIDDDPSVLKALGRLFDSMGLSVDQFAEPARFLSFAKTHQVSLAFIDVNMPAMNGFQVLAQLRIISQETCAVVMSGVDNPANRAAALSGGAIAFLVKPIEADRLSQILQQALVRPVQS